MQVWVLMAALADEDPVDKCTPRVKNLPGNAKAFAREIPATSPSLTSNNPPHAKRKGGQGFFSDRIS